MYTALRKVQPADTRSEGIIDDFLFRLVLYHLRPSMSLPSRSAHPEGCRLLRPARLAGWQLGRRGGFPASSDSEAAAPGSPTGSPGLGGEGGVAVSAQALTSGARGACGAASPPGQQSQHSGCWLRAPGRLRRRSARLVRRSGYRRAWRTVSCGDFAGLSVRAVGPRGTPPCPLCQR